MEFLPKETKEGAPVPGCSCFFMLKMSFQFHLVPAPQRGRGSTKREEKADAACAGFANCSLLGPELSPRYQGLA